jgi:transcriptional regulator with XRE-family HTH domain
VNREAHDIFIEPSHAREIAREDDGVVELTDRGERGQWRFLFELTRNVARSREANKLSRDTSIPTTTHDDSARKALGAFLRTMRARVEPANGARAKRRRVRGLRREEVAAAAGISLTWYTWLEQGRPVRVSATTLRAVGRALRLGPTERAHLSRLASAAMGNGKRLTVTREASDALEALVDSLAPNPVYVVNGVWDVVYRNRAADLVFGDFDREPGMTDNVLRRLLLDPEWRELFADWESVAESAIAQFRAATGHLVGQPMWQRFVERLSKESPWFAERWSAQVVRPSVSYTKIVRHATAGRLTMLYASLAPSGEPADVRMILYSPADPETSRRTLAALAKS